MWLNSIRIRNVKCFADTGLLTLSKGINLFVGPNNAGKTTILRTVFGLQSDDVFGFLRQNIRVKESDFSVNLQFEEAIRAYFPSIISESSIQIKLSSLNGAMATLWLQNTGQGHSTQVKFPAHEPTNWIYPFLVGRKAHSFDEHVTEDKAISVSEQNSQLYSKIDRLCSYGHWASEDYIRVCKSLFGVAVTTTASKGGKRGGITVGKTDVVPLTAMGEGSKSLLGLVADLCIAEPGKLFLIEEIENDILRCSPFVRPKNGLS